jgi:hypothetical protein
LHVFELVQTRAQDVVRDPAEDRRKHKEDGDSAIDTRQVTNNFLRLCGKRRLRETERGRRGRDSRRFDNLRFRGLRLIVREKMREKSQSLIRVWVKIRAISFRAFFRIRFLLSTTMGYRPFSSPHITETKNENSYINKRTIFAIGIALTALFAEHLFDDDTNFGRAKTPEVLSANISYI